MTLDEYRLQTLRQIRDCVSPANGVELVADAHLVLSQSHLTVRTLQMFWSQLRADLDVLSEELMHTAESAERAARSGILAAVVNAVALRQSELTWAPNSSDLKP
jgi:hypothetical protein